MFLILHFLLLTLLRYGVGCFLVREASLQCTCGLGGGALRWVCKVWSRVQGCGPSLCSLCTSGVVRLHVNSWLEVSFCLPHKIHYAASSLIPPEAIERSLKAIR